MTRGHILQSPFSLVLLNLMSDFDEFPEPPKPIRVRCTCGKFLRCLLMPQYRREEKIINRYRKIIRMEERFIMEKDREIRELKRRLGELK